MPKLNYEYNGDIDLYTAMYEQYYFKNSTNKKVSPIKKKKNKRKKTIYEKFIFVVFTCLLMFYVFPYSFNNYIKDVFANRIKNVLKADYQSIMYPTNNYLYKDLFLGKYPIKDTVYKNHLMVDIPQTAERIGLKNNLIALANEYAKIQPAVYVWEYQGKSYVDINADTPYPAASIIKIPVLIEMFRNIDQGNLSLYDTMMLEDFYRAPGSGKLQYAQGDKNYTIDYLAKIMIENSDNSATNMLMAKMGGMPEINRAMNRWGIKTTHINTWLPDLDGTNITTAREMAKMFYNIDSTPILSQSSKRQAAEYLSHVKNNRLLQAGLPQNAILLHKTGDIGYMLGDAGIVKTASGKKYIVVILARRPYNNLQGKEFIVKASEMIYNNIEY